MDERPDVRITGALLTAQLTALLLSLLAGFTLPLPASAADPGKPVKGQCYALTVKDLNKKVNRSSPVACTRTHTSEVAGVPDLPPSISYQSSAETILEASLRVCAKPYAALVGGERTQRAVSRYVVKFFQPTQAQIDDGARWVRCDVILLRSTDVSPLPVATQPFLKRGITDQIRRCGTAKQSFVPCTTKHGYRATGAFHVDRKAYPTQRQFQGLVNKNCRKFVGHSAGYATIKDPVTWSTGDRTITCFKQTKS